VIAGLNQGHPEEQLHAVVRAREDADRRHHPGRQRGARAYLLITSSSARAGPRCRAGRCLRRPRRGGQRAVVSKRTTGRAIWANAEGRWAPPRLRRSLYPGRP
jgi:hypothetical protein